MRRGAARGSNDPEREALLGFAEGAGYEAVRLWTHESHQAAGRVYARNGFTLLSSQPVQSFGQELVEQSWEKRLSGP